MKALLNVVLMVVLWSVAADAIYRAVTKILNWDSGIWVTIVIFAIFIGIVHAVESSKWDDLYDWW